MMETITKRAQQTPEQKFAEPSTATADIVNTTLIHANCQAKTDLHPTPQQMVEQDLAKSGLSWEDVKAYGWDLLHKSDELKRILGFASYNGQDLLQATYAIVKIPYPKQDFARVKLYPSIAGAKYLQPKDIAPTPYIVEQVSQLKDKTHKPIVITEGEKKALCLIKNGYNAIGLAGVWQFKNNNELVPELAAWTWKERTVHICFDSDSITNPHVLKAELELGFRLFTFGAKVFIIRLPQENHADKLGVDDFIAAFGVEAFKEAYKNAKALLEAYPSNCYQEVIDTLKRLYETKAILGGQLGLIVAALSKAWKIKKSDIEADIKDPKEEEQKPSLVEELEPFEGEVDGAALADEVESILKAHVYLGEEAQYIAVTLWVFLTYVFDYLDILPMLLITSPTKRCGKTTLLMTVEALTNRALIASNISPAAVYRTIDAYEPTLLIDEADTGLAENEELRGIINAGHTRRTAFVIRTGDKANNFKPERFNIFCPRVISMIGLPNPTWIDRSVIIKLQRKSTAIKLERTRSSFFEACKPLRQKMLKWAQASKDFFELLNADTPDNDNDFELLTADTPDNDRAIDNWEPLLTIAEVLGDEWKQKALIARKTLENAKEKDEDNDDTKTQLLKDIKRAFEDIGDKLPTKNLLEYLNALDESPWADFRHGKGLNANTLAKMLKGFGITSKTIRTNSATYKGYEAEQFVKIFSVYVSGALQT